jgi:hypothetical protein
MGQGIEALVPTAFDMAIRSVLTMCAAYQEELMLRCPSAG